MGFLNDKTVTRIVTVIYALTFCFYAEAQKATSLKKVESVYVGSLGSNEGVEELRRELINVLRHTRRLRLVSSQDLADAVLEGKGGLWIRGYHSLSPRARTNPNSAEPIYTGFLSIKVQGKDGETLWSYLANPKRISFSDLKHDLASQLVGKLVDDISNAPDTTDAPLRSSETVVTLNGAGATFPFPIYQDWFRSFHARHPNWHLEYQPIGSEAGLKQLMAGTVDFAGSDIPASTSVKQVPTVGGAVVLIYNLPRFGDELRLTAGAIADIFSGKIKTWNDPALRALNRRSSLPRAPITVVHRADGSGTTFALADYLAKTTGRKMTWPVGEGAAGNEGVAKRVADTPYSLGYVEFIYAFDHHLSFASIANSAGRFIQADLASIEAAAGTANAPGQDAYPISTFSWLMFHEPIEATKREAISSFLEWMLTSGQRECSALGYAPLPKSLVDRELDALTRARSIP